MDNQHIIDDTTTILPNNFIDTEAQNQTKAAEESFNDQVKFLVKVKNSILMKAISKACGIVERRNTMPVLANLLLDATDKNLLLITSTDMDIMPSETIEVEVIKSGKITAPALMMQEIFRKFSDQENVILEVINNQLNIKIKNSIFDLPILPAEQFPTIIKDKAECNFKLKASEIIYLIDKTRFAISNEESRYYLNGIYLHHSLQENHSFLKAASTDLHRLACANIDLPQGAENMPGIILPKKTIFELRKILDNTDSIVELAVSTNKVVFKAKNTELITKLIDGNFPDYEGVIPKELKNTMRVDATEFQKAVDRMAIFASDKSKSVKLNIDSDKMIVHSGFGALAKGQDEVTIADYHSKQACQIGFNARYLLDVLNVIKGDWVTLSFNDENSAILLTDEGDNSCLYIIMPIRI